MNAQNYMILVEVCFGLSDGSILIFYSFIFILMYHKCSQIIKIFVNPSQSIKIFACSTRFNLVFFFLLPSQMYLKNVQEWINKHSIAQFRRVSCATTTFYNP